MFYQALDTGTIGHGKQSFLSSAEMVKKIGFEGFWFDATRDLTDDVGQLQAMLAKTGLLPSGFGLPVEFRQDEARFQEGLVALLAYAKTARAIGITRCATWIMPAHESLGFEENFKLHQERLRLVAQVLKDEGIRLGLEFVSSPHLFRDAKNPFIHDLKGMLSLCDALGTGNAGILLDAWHWHLSGHDFGDFSLFTNQEQIVLAHVMDAPANVPDLEQKDNVRRLPGSTGVINIDAFFAGLMMVGYEGPVSVEPFEPYLANLPFEQAATLVKKRLDSVWPV